MGQSSRRKKIHLFQKYSRNLNWFLENVKGRIQDSDTKQIVPNPYICPLCLDFFNETDLDSSAENMLTIEHVPPKSLGGKSQLLTCKSCNSKSGHELDNHLLEKLLEVDFQSFLPNSETKATFELNGNTVNGVVKIDANKNFIIDLQTQRSNPKQSEIFMKDISPRFTYKSPLFDSSNPFGSRSWSTPTFSLIPKSRGDMRRAEIALLRTAYLLACATFGHSFFVGQVNLNKVRRQILNPDQEILQAPYWINYDFSDEMNGINIVKTPKDLNCFLIVFDLLTKSKKRKFAIALPGFTDTEATIYRNIKDKLCSDEKGTQSVVIDHHCGFEYFDMKEHSIDAHHYWKMSTQ